MRKVAGECDEGVAKCEELSSRERENNVSYIKKGVREREREVRAHVIFLPFSH